MARDIEEFLRRAAERRQQQKAQQGQSPPKAQPPARRPIVEPEIVEVEIVEPTLVPKKPRQRPGDSPIARQKLKSEMRTESVSQHVERHLDTRRLVEHAESLGKRVASVHDQVEREVHKHLDHDITVIDDKPTITDDERPGVVGSDTSPQAADLLQMLTQPKTIRQAILMAEILKVPEWDD